MRKRARMMRESKSIRSKWSSVPPNCRTHHSHHRGGGHLDHNARGLLLGTGSIPRTNLVLLRVGRGKLVGIYLCSNIPNRPVWIF